MTDKSLLAIILNWLFAWRFQSDMRLPLLRIEVSKWFLEGAILMAKHLQTSMFCSFHQENFAKDRLTWSF